MVNRYYLDTSIWMDLYEDRVGFKNEPLGDYAWKLLALIKSKNHKLVISDLVLKELEISYSLEKIKGMIMLFENILERIISTDIQKKEAMRIADKRNLPPGDVLHAILARDNRLILITRDKHFLELEDISKHHKPEEFI